MKFSQFMLYYASATSIHGIKDLLQTQNRLVRLIWAVFLTATSVLMLYEIAQIVQSYLKQQTATKIQFQKMTRRDFAKIIRPYICLSDWMSQSKARELNFTFEQLLVLDAFSNENSGLFLSHMLRNKTAQKSYSKTVKWLKFYNNALVNGTLLEEFYRPLIKNFEFTPIVNYSNFAKYLILVDAVCFGIQLDLATDVVGHPIYRTVLRFHPNDTIKKLRRIHDKIPDKPNMYITFYHGSNMRYVSELHKVNVNYTVTDPPLQLNLRVEFRHIKRLSLRRAPCVTHAKESDIDIPVLPVGYERHICMQRCMDENIYSQHFNCTFLKPKTIEQGQDYVTTQAEYAKSLSLCSAEKFYFSKEYTSQDLAAVLKCQDTCENAVSFCSEWDISIKRERYVEPRTCTEAGCLNLAIVAQPKFEVNEEVYLMNADTLLSNIGGQAGLWFGGSVLSLVQLIVFCAWYWTGKCRPIHSSKKYGTIVHTETC